MEKRNKNIYAIRLILFIIQFYLVFILIPNILSVGLFGYIFLIIYFFYNVMILRELLTKKKKYRYDLIYNFMQIGFIFYLIIINFKIYYDHLYVIKQTLGYFNVNYIIMTLLLIFIIIYSLFELRLRKDKK